MAGTTERAAPTLRSTAWWWCALVCVVVFGAGHLVGALLAAGRGYTELALVIAPAFGTVLAFAATATALLVATGRALPAIAVGLAAVLVAFLATSGVTWATRALFPGAFDDLPGAPLYYLSLLVGLLLAYPLAAVAAQSLLPRLDRR